VLIVTFANSHNMCSLVKLRHGPESAMPLLVICVRDFILRAPPPFCNYCTGIDEEFLMIQEKI
jgi:hypothetical protein